LRILDLLGVEARRQSVAEGIATEIDPGIYTATEHLAVPIAGRDCIHTVRFEKVG
jgi:hypothetical protein